MGYCETVLGFVPVDDNEKFDPLIFIFSKLRLKEEFNAKYPSLVGKERVCMKDLCDDFYGNLSMFDYELFPDMIMNVEESEITFYCFTRDYFKVDGLSILDIQDDSYFTGLVFCHSDRKKVEVDFSNLQMFGHDLNDWYEQGRLPKMKLVLQEIY